MLRQLKNKISSLFIQIFKMRQYFPHNFIIFLEQVRNGPGQVEHLSNELSVKLSLQVIILSRIFTLNIYGGWFSIISASCLLFYCLFFGRCLHIRMKGCVCSLMEAGTSVFILTVFKHLENWTFGCGSLVVLFQDSEWRDLNIVMTHGNLRIVYMWSEFAPRSHYLVFALLLMFSRC